MQRIPQIADKMFTVLTTVADQIGRATGFVQRQSRVSGSVFVRYTHQAKVPDQESPLQ